MKTGQRYQGLTPATQVNPPDRAPAQLKTRYATRLSPLVVLEAVVPGSTEVAVENIFGSLVEFLIRVHHQRFLRAETRKPSTATRSCDDASRFKFSRQSVQLPAGYRCIPALVAAMARQI